jgi:hypothetical protein
LTPQIARYIASQVRDQNLVNGGKDFGAMSDMPAAATRADSEKAIEQNRK